MKYLLLDKVKRDKEIWTFTEKYLNQNHLIIKIKIYERVC